MKMPTLVIIFSIISLPANSANIVCQGQGIGQGAMIAYSHGQPLQKCSGHCEFVAYGGPITIMNKDFTLYPNQNGIIVDIANTGTVYKVQNVTLNCSPL